MVQPSWDTGDDEDSSEDESHLHPSESKQSPPPSPPQSKQQALEDEDINNNNDLPTSSSATSTATAAAKRKGPRRKRADQSDAAEATTVSGWGDDSNSGFVKRDGNKAAGGWGNSDANDNDDGNNDGESKSSKSKSKSSKGGGGGGGFAAEIDNDDPQSSEDEDAQNSSAKKGSKSAGLRKGRAKHFESSSANDDIMLIPDLDDSSGEEDITVQVASAPRNITRKIATLAELDQVSFNYYNSSLVNGIDLSVLTSKLVPFKMVEEGGEEWSFEKLIMDVREGGFIGGDCDGDAVSETVGSGVGGGESKVKAKKVDYDNRDLNDVDTRKLEETLGTGGVGKSKREAVGGRRARRSA